MAKKRAVKKVVKKKVTAKKRKLVRILPKKMSALIGIALKDIKKAEALPDEFRVKMNSWFKNKEFTCTINGSDEVISTGKICVACAAGSVMAFSLGARGSKKEELYPANFPRNKAQLEAIDFLRSGWSVDAAIRLNIVKQDDEYSDSKRGSLYRKIEDTICDIPPYDSIDPEPFHKAMTAYQAVLKKAGL